MSEYLVLLRVTLHIVSDKGPFGLRRNGFWVLLKSLVGVFEVGEMRTRGERMRGRCLDFSVILVLPGEVIKDRRLHLGFPITKSELKGN